MVHEPLKVKDYVNPIESTRKELLQEEDSKIKGRRGITLKGFKTEKERIQEKLQNNDFIFSNPNLNSEDEKRHTDTNESHVLQPRMRFKPRTDLERVFEEVNKNSFGRVDKSLIDKQLRELDLNVVIQPKDEHELLDFQTSQSLNKLTYSRPDIINRAENEKSANKKESKKPHWNERRKIMNQEAKNLMSDLHVKTHFKAAATMATKLGKKNYPITKYNIFFRPGRLFMYFLLLNFKKINILDYFPISYYIYILNYIRL